MPSSDGADSSSSTNIPVRTTLPRLPTLAQRPIIQTARLLLRALKRDDLTAFHALRLQPEFMAESTLGKPDADEAESQAALDSLIEEPPSPSGREHFVFGIFIASTGELIGDGGIHTVRGGGMGWPELGYKLSPAHWGCGYATEAMSAILEAWWALPRELVEIAVYPGTLFPTTKGEGKEKEKEKGEEGLDVVRSSQECVVADVAHYNDGSRRVLGKLGFVDFGFWEEPDTQLHRLGQPLLMGHFVLAKSS